MSEQNAVIVGKVNLPAQKPQQKPQRRARPQQQERQKKKMKHADQGGEVRASNLQQAAETQWLKAQLKQLRDRDTKKDAVIALARDLRKTDGECAEPALLEAFDQALGDLDGK
jgi:hypothetical protein